MYQLCKLILKSYMPKQLSKGMIFLTNVGKEAHVFELDYVPADMDKFVEYNGYPREPYLIVKGNPNLNEDFVIAEPEQIGWFDEGDHSDEYRDITINDIKTIVNYYDGDVLVEVLEQCDEDGKPIPIIYDGDKVAMRLDFDEELEQDYLFNGDEDWTDTELNNQNDES